MHRGERRRGRVRLQPIAKGPRAALFQKAEQVGDRRRPLVERQPDQRVVHVALVGEELGSKRDGPQIGADRLDGADRALERGAGAETVAACLRDQPHAVERLPLLLDEARREGAPERRLEIAPRIFVPANAAQHLAAIQQRLRFAAAIRRRSGEPKRRVEGGERAFVVRQVEGVDDADVAPGADLAVAMRRLREQALRRSIQIERLGGIAEPPDQRALIDEELGLLAGLHRLAGGELGVEVERPLVGAEPRVERGKIRHGHLPQPPMRGRRRQPAELAERVLIDRQRVGIASQQKVHVADVVEAGDLAIAGPGEAIEIERAMIRVQRRLVAAEVLIREADRVEVPRRVRTGAEALVQLERALRLTDGGLIVPPREGRVGGGRQGARLLGTGLVVDLGRAPRASPPPARSRSRFSAGTARP